MSEIKKLLWKLRNNIWTKSECISYFIYLIANKINIGKKKCLDYHKKIRYKTFKSKYLKIDDIRKERYFDINGAKLPDLSVINNNLFLLVNHVFEDVFIIPCFYNDNYNNEIVNYVDQFMNEGPYSYKDGAFDVTVKKDDIVIDAGAWIGDFSAYAVTKGAISYAFEPVEDAFQLLCKTVELNEGKITPVKQGLGSKEEELDIFISKTNSGSSSLIFKKEIVSDKKITICTLDNFVEKNNLERVDFIKADIEGAERDMLQGATQVLREFAPKLAICTYHLPDDPEVLEKIILEANPNYRIVHIKHKLFAAVEN